MKIVKLNESDLKRIIKRVISEQIIADYEDIVNFLKSRNGKEIQKNKFEFINPKNGNSQFVEISDKIKTYTKDKKNKISDLVVLNSYEELKNLMSPEN